LRASDQIRQFMMDQEGFRDTAYKPLPTDRWTYGYGTTYKLDGSPVNEGDIISQEDAASIFNKTLDNLAIRISYLTNPACTQNQFDAFLSLCYNIGFTGVTTSTTGQMFHNGEDIADRFLLWDKSGGQVVQGLVNRRQKERNIYLNGDYSS